MASDKDRPGVTLRLLQPLAALPEKVRPGELNDQLVAAEQRYGADPYIAQALGESAAQISPPSSGMRSTEKPSGDGSRKPAGVTRFYE